LLIYPSVVFQGVHSLSHLKCLYRAAVYATQISALYLDYNVNQACKKRIRL